MSSDKVLYVNPETKDVIATGNVGIGTDNPQEKLHVNGNVNVSGNVGIGTDNPQAKLHVNGNVNVSGSFLKNGIPGMLIRNFHEEYDSAGYTLTNSYQVVTTWTNRTYSPNSKLAAYVYIPWRNDSGNGNWGGMMFRLEYNINGTGWLSMGESGYHMVLNVLEILQYSNWYYLALSQSSSFTCQFRYQCRGHDGDGPATINANNANTTGTTNSYGVNPYQTFMKILIVEMG